VDPFTEEAMVEPDYQLHVGAIQSGTDEAEAV